jgi:mono/diheme cytochrome c family protein
VNLEGGAGPALNNVGARLRQEDILAVISQGRGMMPGFEGRLNEQEITALAEWLSLKKE